MSRRETETCEICGSITNQWVLAGYPGVGWRLLCPLRKKTPKKHDWIGNLQEERRITASPSLKKILQNDIENLREKLGSPLRDVAT